MTRKSLQICAAALLLMAAGCTRKQAKAPPAPAAPPPPKQNVFVLLPDPEGKATSIVVRNQAGAQDLSQSYQAVGVERQDVAPTAPFPLDQPEVRRLFGAALDVLPGPEIAFLLHFDSDRDELDAPSAAQIPAILNAIRDRRSTAITVTGHTDTTNTPAYNDTLGLRRARRVAGLLIDAGVKESDLSVSSHGQADLLEKTGPGTPNAANRRVEVVVR